MKSIKRIFFSVLIFILLLVFSLFLSSCTTSIAAIKRAPSEFAGRDIFINGMVERLFSIPFSKVKIVKINDGTDSIYLLSDKGGRIQKDKRMHFKGEIVVIGGDNSAKKMEIAISRISGFLVRNNITDKKEVRKYAMKIIFFVKKIFNDRTAFVFFIDKD